MKSRLLLIALIIFWHKSNAQIATNGQQNILRNWVKYRVEMKDGSQVPDESIAKNTASMLIFKKGNKGVIINGKDAQQMSYIISDSILVLGATTTYVIEKLTKDELVFYGNSKDTPDNEIIKYYYISTTESSSQYFYRQFIKPNIRIQANGDTAYNFSEYTFPNFKTELGNFPIVLNNFYEVYESSYEMIEKEFDFPAKKKGNFRVSFTVSKLGTLKDVAVKESTDSTYNNALEQAVYQTRKRWLPAEHEDNKVEILFNYVYVYDAKDKPENNFDEYIYYGTKEKADKLFDRKQYVKAIKLYTKCILMQEDDFDLDPYYKRADSYFALKVNKNACLDWSYLAKKGQKKAEKLFLENCMK